MSSDEEKHSRKRPLSELYADNSAEESGDGSGDDSLDFEEIEGEFDDFITEEGRNQSEFDLESRSKPKKLRRLKKKKKSNSEEPDNLGEESHHHEDLENMFDSDEDVPLAEMPGGEDDVPETEEVYVSDQDFSDEEMMHDFVVDEKGMPIKIKEKRKGGITSDQMQMASMIFGVNDFDELMDEEPEEEALPLSGQELKAAHRKILSKAFSPAELQEKYVTEADEKIASVDIPERLQLRSQNRIAPEETELEMEAEWIFNQKLVSLGLDKDTAFEAVVNVLRFLLQEKLEIPFIATYRKEYWLSSLQNVSLLWLIYEWDEKWYQFQQKKQTLKQLYSVIDESLVTKDVPSPHEILDLIESQQTIDELHDARDHFSLHYGEEFEEALQSRKVKRPQKRTPYSIAKQAGISEFKASFGMTAKHFGENLALQYSKHDVRDPDLSPTEIASKYINDFYKTEQDVLEAGRLMLAQQIATDLSVRHALRNTYNIYATISTQPTEEGKRVIDAFHPYRDVKRLEFKPAPDLLGDNPTDKFLKILKAEKEGLLNYQISVPSGTYRYKFIEEMEKYFLSDGLSTVSREWNQQRKLVLEKALQDFLFPLFREQLQAKLQQDASEMVANLCAQKLDKILMVGPFPVKETEEEEGMLPEGPPPVVVMGCYYGNPYATQQPSDIVVIDGQGGFKAHLQLMFQQKTMDSDLAKFKAFIETHKPDVVVLGTNCFSVRVLYDKFHQAISQLNPAFPRPRLALQDSSAAEIYWPTQMAKDEFANLGVSKNFNPSVSRAISIARRMQDPLIEISKFCNKDKDILCLSLHPLQDVVNRNFLATRLERVVINMVNSVGVDINQSVLCPWKAHLLNFVSGLGPRKAAKLIEDLKARGGTVVSRLSLGAFLDDVCYRNACAFLKISLWDLKNKSPTGEYEILDMTRVHPEDYNYAWKMAKDALEKDDSESHVEELMRSPKHLLDTLDIDMFAELLEKKLDSKKRNTLYDIKEELKAPFLDPRMPYQDPDEPQVFDLLTGSDDSTFFVGQIVKVRVLPFNVKDPNIRSVAVLLEGNEMKGFIRRENLADYVQNVADVVQPGYTLNARVIQIDKHEARCYLSAKESDLKTHSFDPPKPTDPYLVEDFYQEEMELAQSQAEASKKERKLFERAIRHPHFKNVDAGAALEYLSDKPPGSFIIRPSSSGYQYLTITWKFYADEVNPPLFVHIPIKEEEKTNDMVLGKRLIIGNEKYDDLKEVVVRFIDPMVEYATAFFEHKRFRPGLKHQVESFIKASKIQNPADIPYAIGVSYEHAGTFVLYFQPGASVHKEFITVSPLGFKFNGKYHSSADSTINYFKRHWKEILERKSHRGFR